MRFRFIAILCWLLIPHIASADCALLSIREAIRLSNIAFSGTVTSISPPLQSGRPGPIVGFNVERVWKGKVTKLFTVYNFSRSLELMHFSVGQSYLVFAHHATAAELRDLELAGPAFIVGDCGGSRILNDEVRKELSRLGRAHLDPVDPLSRSLLRGHHQGRLLQGSRDN
jgi:hypothetical protein